MSSAGSTYVTDLSRDEYRADLSQLTCDSAYIMFAPPPRLLIETPLISLQPTQHSVCRHHWFPVRQCSTMVDVLLTHPVTRSAPTRFVV
jgi:hypothetical protein